MRQASGFRMHVRSLFRRIFYLLLDRLGIRRLREHSFFAALLARPAAVADFGAHCGEFLAAFTSEHPISRALLVEADPALAESLKKRFGDKIDIVQAAVIGETKKGPVRFSRSIEPESSSIFSEWVGAHRVADQLIVPTVDFAEVLQELGGRLDLAKFDIKGAELDVLQTARSSDLAACRQLTVEFHDHGRPPITQNDIDRACQLLRSEGYGLVNANWPYFSDVLFVNLRIMPPAKRIGFGCRVALANALFIGCRLLFGKAAGNLQTIGQHCSQ